MSFGKDSSFVFIMQEGKLVEVARSDTTATKKPLDAIEEEIWRIFREYKKLQTENDNLKELETAAIDGCLRLRDELKAKDEEITRLNERLEYADAQDQQSTKGILALEAENEQLKEDMETGCNHTIDSAVDEDGCCISCGEDLNFIAGQQEEIDRLTAELKTKDERIKELTDAVREALSISKGLWAGVKNHPASQYAKDVEYFEQALKGK